MDDGGQNMGKEDWAYTEAEHNHVSVIIGKRPQPIKFFLSGRIPKAELDVCVVDKDVCACLVSISTGSFVRRQVMERPHTMNIVLCLAD